MSSLVTFDHKGVLGPAVSLLLNFNDYSPAGIEKLSAYVAQRFEKMSGTVPEGRKELCDLAASKEPLSISTLVNTVFFQTMQWQGELPSYHDIVTDLIVPNTLTSIKNAFPDAPIEGYKEKISNWLTGFTEAYVSEKDIRAMSKPAKGSEDAILAKRIEVGRRLYELVQAKELTEKDFDALLNACRSAVGAPNSAVTIEMVIGYLQLFSLGDKALSDDVLGKLDGLFREKLYS